MRPKNFEKKKLKSTKNNSLPKISQLFSVFDFFAFLKTTEPERKSMRENYKKGVFISMKLSPVLVATLQAGSFYHEQHF